MKEIKFCPNHPDKPIKSKGLCRSCYERDLKERNPEYREKQKSNSRKWHEANREYKARWDKQYRQKTGPKTEERYYASILSKFGMTKESYDQLLVSCDNSCQICGDKPYKGKRLHLDHNHATGKVRGLLCTRCNWYLATIERNPDVLDRIREYLNGR